MINLVPSNFSLQRSNDDFTIGLVNLPIKLNPNTLRPEKVYDQKKQRDKYVVIPDMRYPFFELDTDKGKSWEKVMEHYVNHNLDVYAHRTMRGWHFISLTAMKKEDYATWIKCIMPLNPKCPMVTLRIKPNKWIGERQVFKEGGIIARQFNTELEQLKQWIERQAIGLLQLKYYVVRYRMTGEAGNL